MRQRVLVLALLALASTLAAHAQTISGRVYDDRDADGIRDESERQDFLAAHDRLRALVGEIELWRTQAMAGAVYWADGSTSRGGHRRTTLAAAPIDIGPALREQLFEKVPTVVLTSATLSVGKSGSFDFSGNITSVLNSWMHQVGISLDFIERRHGQRVETLYIHGADAGAGLIESIFSQAIKRVVERWEMTSALPNIAVPEGLSEPPEVFSIALGEMQRVMREGLQNGA